ncbi:MAG TPA: hypothetical protein VNJ03_17000 [Vicinamibacterales bacterium]|nr:hypothetical protein [Vicinamibacterales bacterium]
MTPSTLTAGAPSYTQNPVDACEEAAQRINVVLGMLRDHDCRADDGAIDGTGGYELSIMADALEAIRNLLQKAAIPTAEASR